MKLPARRRPRRRDRRASAREGIACAPYLPSIHLQSYMRERYGFAEGLCPVSEDASARTMAIPFHARLAARGSGARRRGARATALAIGLSPARDNRRVADGAPRMIFLGFGKYVRADKIYALEPLGRRASAGTAPARACGSRGSPSRSSPRARSARSSPRWASNPAAETRGILDDALDLAQRVADAAEQGRFDVVDLGRRARRLLESTTAAGAGEPLLSRPASRRATAAALLRTRACTRSRPS